MDAFKRATNRIGDGYYRAFAEAGRYRQRKRHAGRARLRAEDRRRFAAAVLDRLVFVASRGDSE